MIPVVIAILGLFGSTLTYYFTKKQQRESQCRKLRQEYWDC